MERIIEYAEKRLTECNQAGEHQSTLYWAAYLDGARRQKEEQKTAKWEYYRKLEPYSNGIVNPHYRCTACGTPRYEHYASQFKFCPECGARME